MKAEIKLSSVDVNLQKLYQVVKEYNENKLLKFTVIAPDKYNIMWIIKEDYPHIKKALTDINSFIFFAEWNKVDLGRKILLINFKDNIM